MSAHPCTPGPGPRLDRRRALCCTGALFTGLFTGLLPAADAAAHGLPALGEGLRNPCAGRLPRHLADHDLVHRAFEGLDASRLWDAHAHLLGTGDSGSGCTVHPAASQWWQPVEVLRRKMILDAACIPADAPDIDRAYVARLHRQADDFPAGARWLLFAFSMAHDDQGRPHPGWSTFHVPDAYAARVAAESGGRFGWVASVHPYRPQAIDELHAARRAGALAVKWLPSAMNIDLRDARCRPFYDALAVADLPLIVHCGEEHAVPGARRSEFGNPLLVRRPLEQGVRVIVAHAASLGRARDLDAPGAPVRPAFDLWARLMDEPAWQGRLLADISAVSQVNRSPRLTRTLIERDDWHARLLHGSDHPLPGVMPLVSPGRLAQSGLLDERAVEPLRCIREHNPLLFDFVLKRVLRVGARGFSASVFDTARHFGEGALRYRAA